jgi:hypothetical protein
MVIAHHPHVCQGIEWHNGGLITYSLGNHVIDVVEHEYQRPYRGTDESMLLQVNVDFSGGRPRLEAITHPLKIDHNHRPVPCGPDTAVKQSARIAELGRQLADGRTIRAAWRQTCWRQIRRHVLGTYCTWYKSGLGAALVSNVRLLRNPECRYWI